MFSCFLKVALRNLFRHKVFSLINIAGLSIGLACCMLIALWVQYELSYDRFFDGSDRIHRVLTRFDSPTQRSELMNMAPRPLYGALKEQFPEVSAVTRMGGRGALIRYEDQAYNETGVFYVDEGFLNVFDFPVLVGDKSDALSQPYQVWITQNIAHKLFGDDEPVGKTLHYGTVFDLQVAGVLENPPRNSHLQFNYLISSATRRAHWGEDDVGGGSYMFGQGEWDALSGALYVKLHEGTDAAAFNEKLTSFVGSHKTGELDLVVALQPVTDIHLHGHTGQELEENGDIRYVYFISGIGLLILLIACFNYMNLSTARSSGRAREVGMRKVLGAQRFHLVRQFLGESLILALVATIIAVALVELSLPFFCTLIGSEFSSGVAANPQFLPILLALAGSVGTMAGLYPALFFASFRPLSILRAFHSSGSRGASVLRNVLVVLQYAFSICLVICTAVVYQQLNFVNHTDLGFEADNVVALELRDFRPTGSVRELKEKLLAHPGVKELTTSVSYPISGGGGASRSWWDGKAEGEHVYFHYNRIDYNYLDFYRIELLSGRRFSTDHPSDADEAYIMNEAAVRVCGWTPETAIGKTFGLTPKARGTVVGVVRDYHFASLREEVGPQVLRLKTGMMRSISARLDPDRTAEALAFVDDIWKDYSIFPLEFSFIDDRIKARYLSEERLRRIFVYSTAIAIFVACLGLYGLASYAAERRTREIGVRKVLGASITGIVMMLSRQFTRWVLLSNLIAWPLAWYAVDSWLQNFAYRVDVGPAVFVAAGASALFIALGTVAFESIRAARANPVEALKCE